MWRIGRGAAPWAHYGTARSGRSSRPPLGPLAPPLPQFRNSPGSRPPAQAVQSRRPRERRPFVDLPRSPAHPQPAAMAAVQAVMCTPTAGQRAAGARRPAAAALRPRPAAPLLRPAAARSAARRGAAAVTRAVLDVDIASFPTEVVEVRVSGLAGAGPRRFEARSVRLGLAPEPTCGGGKAAAWRRCSPCQPGAPGRAPAQQAETPRPSNLLAAAPEVAALRARPLPGSPLRHPTSAAAPPAERRPPSRARC